MRLPEGVQRPLWKAEDDALGDVVLSILSEKCSIVLSSLLFFSHIGLIFISVNCEKYQGSRVTESLNTRCSKVLLHSYSQ